MSAVDRLFRSRRTNKDDAEHWIGISDMMSGLMMVFLFMAVAYMYFTQVEQETMTVERESIKKIVDDYSDTQKKIYDDLLKEFREDLKHWNAEVNPENLEVTFKNPEVLFSSGSSDLNNQFKAILSDFFPRYVAVISRYRQDIEEIRIEGHTSSDWGGLQGEQAYFPNMELSQNRTRSVLQYVVSLLTSGAERDWVRANFAAVGYSSSRLKMDGNVENSALSRRVNFRVITKSELQIRNIIEKLDGNQG